MDGKCYGGKKRRDREPGKQRCLGTEPWGAPVRGDEKELAKETEEEQPERRSGEPGMLERRVLRRRKWTAASSAGRI